MNFSSFIAFVIIATLQETEAFTVVQIRKLAAPIIKNCMESTNADEVLVNGMRDGKLVDNKELKCFLYCFYESLGIVSTKLRLHKQ